MHKETVNIASQRGSRVRRLERSDIRGVLSVRRRPSHHRGRRSFATRTGDGRDRRAYATERGEEQQLGHALLGSQPRRSDTIHLIARVAGAVEGIHLRPTRTMENPKVIHASPQLRANEPTRSLLVLMNQLQMEVHGSRHDDSDLPVPCVGYSPPIAR